MELHWQGSREERVRTVDAAARTLREYGGLYLGRWNSKTIERLAVDRSNRDAVLTDIIGAGWDDVWLRFPGFPPIKGVGPVIVEQRES